MISCKQNYSSLNTVGDDECSSLKDLVASSLDNPSLTSNIKLSDEQYNKVFASGVYDPYAFSSAVFDSAKNNRANILKNTILDIECKINSLNNKEEQSGNKQDTNLEECSNKYICSNCSLESLENMLSEYQDRLMGVESCNFDNSMRNSEEMSKNQDLIIYSSFLVNNSNDLNEGYITLWEAAIKEYYSQNPGEMVLDILATFVKENKSVASSSVDRTLRFARLTKVCAKVNDIFQRAQAAKNSKVVGFCVNCVATLVGMCQAAVQDTQIFAKSKVFEDDQKVKVYVDNFIKKIVTSLAICTGKQIFKRTWSSVAQRIQDFVRKGQKTIVAGEFKPDPKDALGAALCELGFGLLGDVISMDLEINHKAPCKSMLSWTGDKTRLASCARTVATLCSALMYPGYVNIGSVLPSTDNVWLNSLYVLGDVGVTFTCQAGGKEFALLCSAISAAASQIKIALLTGNNDWAHCMMFDQLGECTGVKWAEYFGKMSLSYASSPIEKLKKNDSGLFEGDMCLCERHCYVKKIGFDNNYKTENVFSYAGDVSDPAVKYKDCKSFEGRKIKHGVPALSGVSTTYAKYRNCKLVKVKFSNSQNTNASVPMDGTQVEYQLLNENGQTISFPSRIKSQSFEGCRQ